MSIRRAIGYILCVTLAISGTTAAWVILSYYHAKEKAQDPDYQVRALVQRSSGKYQLPTSALIELLNLSVDQPQNLYNFNTDAAGASLRSLGIFKSLQISKIPPETLLIDYELREPLAYLDDIANTAIDNELIAFPFFPYFTPKKMPVLRLNREGIQWNTSVVDAETSAFLKSLFTQIEAHTFQDEKISWIDVSSQLENQNPLQEIILGIDAKTKKWIRVSADNLEDQIHRYVSNHALILEWEKTKSPQQTIVDLRFNDIILLSLAKRD